MLLYENEIQLITEDERMKRKRKRKEAVNECAKENDGLNLNGMITNKHACMHAAGCI